MTILSFGLSFFFQKLNCQLSTVNWLTVDNSDLELSTVSWLTVDNSDLEFFSLDFYWKSVLT